MLRRYSLSAAVLVFLCSGCGDSGAPKGNDGEAGAGGDGVAANGGTSAGNGGSGGKGGSGGSAGKGGSSGTGGITPRGGAAGEGEAGAGAGATGGTEGGAPSGAGGSESGGVPGAGEGGEAGDALAGEGGEAGGAVAGEGGEAGAHAAGAGNLAGAGGEAGRGEVPVCEPGTAGPSCAPCELGTFSDSENAATCQAWTECGAGSEVELEGTETHDRTCAGCPSGTYSVTPNASACEAWSDCPVHTFVTNTPSATLDRSCAPCEAGTAAPEPNLSSCVPLDACAPGTEETVPAGAHTAPTCEPCEIGTYCAGASTEKASCGADTWDHDANPATACADRTGCVAGERVTSDGSPTSDRACAACPTGSYSSTTNASACLPHTCQPGTQVTAPGTNTAPPTCAPCEPGTHCPGGLLPKMPCPAETWDHDLTPATACLPFRVCASGEYRIAEGSPTANRTCAACDPGSFSVGPNAVSCTPWDVCPIAQFVSRPGSESQNRQCSPCPLGFMSTTTNASECQLVAGSICPASPTALVWDTGITHYLLSPNGGLAKDTTVGWGNIAQSVSASFSANEDFCFEQITIPRAGYNQVMFGVRFSDFTGAYLNLGTYLDAGNNYRMVNDVFTHSLTYSNADVPNRYSVRRVGSTVTIAVNGVSIFEQTGAAWTKAGTPSALIWNDVTRIESAMGQ